MTNEELAERVDRLLEIFDDVELDEWHRPYDGGMATMNLVARHPAASLRLETRAVTEGLHLTLVVDSGIRVWEHLIRWRPLGGGTEDR